MSQTPARKQLTLLGVGGLPRNIELIIDRVKATAPYRLINHHLQQPAKRRHRFDLGWGRKTNGRSMP